jgi:uncharacterized OB-fold protein
MKGVVLSWTLVHRAPAGIPTPFVLALVKTPEGHRLARCEAAPAAIGAEVGLVWDEEEGMFRA